MDIEKKFYLTQRIEKQWNAPRDDKEGVDAYFAFDYMGSSEFEWGALPKALRDMRKGWKEEEPVIVRINAYIPLDDIEEKDNGVTCHVWFVGNREDLEDATDFFNDQLTDRKIRIHERTCMSQAYGIPEGPYDKASSFYDRLIGWWALNGLICLFRDEEDAKIWKREVLNGQ